MTPLHTIRESVKSDATDFRDRVSTLADQARALQVMDQESYDRAAQAVRGVAQLRKEIVAHHEPMKRAAHAAWQAVLEQERKLLDPVAEAERIFKQRLAAYDAEQRRIEAESRAQAQKKADALAAVQREHEIEAAELAGADAQEIAAICNEPLPVVMPDVSEPVFQKAAGISTAANWKGTCISLQQLVKAIAEGKANLNLVSDNPTAINQLARATRGTLQVPGIRFYNEPSVRVRR